ncbi:sensor histidine kinase [Taklimakanibacter deserti]|uniref:sensor histidine kinase n=1 Tax=Taklimakanibacter deserti TaxID=2267839 RepID=UPI000E6566A9
MQTIAIFTVTILQAGLVSWLLHERGKRRRSEADASDLSRQLIHAQEAERARLACELHDDVTQRLARLAIDAARHARGPVNPGVHNGMKSIHDGLVRLGEDVHALSYRLHPSILTDLGLAEAVKSECENFSQSSTQLEVKTLDIPDDLPHDIALCLYRIVQESLRNVARHSKASRTEVHLSRLDDGLQITISDNGVGFDPRHRREGMTLGLASMRQRLASHTGRLDIASSPGHGTTVTAWVPLSPAGTDPANLSKASERNLNKSVPACRRHKYLMRFQSFLLHPYLRKS